MWADIIKQLLEFRWMIMVIVCVGIAISIASAVLTKNLGWDQKRWKFLGIFAGLSGKELLWLSFCLTRCLFFISVVAFRIDLGLAQICVYVLLCLGSMVLLPRIKRVMLDLINSIVVFGAMMAAGILSGYLAEVRSDGYIMTIFVLLSIFTVVYAVYFLLKDMTEMLQERKNIRQRAEENI